MRALAAAAVLLAGLAGAPATARASGRLDRAAAALRASGLYVDADLSWLLGPADRAAVAGLQAGAAVPLLIAVMPSLDADESGGDTQRALAGLWARVHRPAVYVTVEQHGWLDLAAPGVRRRVRIPLSLAVPGFESRPTTTVVARLRQVARLVDAAPPGPPGGVPRPQEPFPSLGGGPRAPGPLPALVGGALLGAVAFALAGRVARRRRRAGSTRAA